LPGFRKFSPAELQFVSRMRRSQIACDRRESVIREGQATPSIYTLYEGWAARVRRLPDGTPQIVDILLPGDLIGLSSYLGTANHSVVALTPVTLCALDAKQLKPLLRTQPALGLSMVRALTLDQERADNRITMLGRLAATERVGFFLLELKNRLTDRNLASGSSCPYPLRHSQLAEAVGLSMAQVMRALRELRLRGLALIRNRQLDIPDARRLARFSQYRPIQSDGKQPLL
jgi:CRP-like cAMP-binding protein